MKTYKLYILIGFLVLTGAQKTSACVNGNPCINQTPTPTLGQTGSYGYAQPYTTGTGSYQPALPQVYGNGGEVAVVTTPTLPQIPTPTPKPDYSYISPIIFNQDGSTLRQTTGTTSNNASGTTSTQDTSSNTSNGGIFDGLFGTKKTVFGSVDSQNVTVDQNLRATVESKGLAMGTNSLSCGTKGADYVILYKNITKEVLSSVAIRVSLPDNVRPTKTNVGSYSERDNTITIFVGNLNIDQEGQFVINGEYVNTESSGNVARSEMVYTLPNQNQNMIVAYAFGAGNCAENNSALGASVAGSNFFGGTLLGWVFLALFVSALIYLIRFFLKEKENGHGAHAHGH